METGLRLRYVLPGGGHALLVDPERLNLATALRASKLYAPELKQKAFDKAQNAVRDFVPPNATTVADTRRRVVDPLRRLVSPVFFSTLEDGSVVRGLEGVPPPGSKRPVLLVGNHQLFGSDLSLLVDEFLKEKDLLIRGLAHPVATNAPSLNGAGGLGGPRTAPEWWADSQPRRDGFQGNSGGDTFFQTFGRRPERICPASNPRPGRGAAPSAVPPRPRPRCRRESPATVPPRPGAAAAP